MSHTEHMIAAEQDGEDDSMITSPAGHVIDMAGDTARLTGLPLAQIVDTTLDVATPVVSAAEIVLALEDDKTLQQLNRDWREKDKPTNVLSFPAVDGDDFENQPLFAKGMAVHLGDIIISAETTAREALEANKSFHDHLSHLFVHGLLHLLGYDHIDDKEAEEMEALEVSILAKFGIANPYLAGNEGPIDG